MEGGGRDGEGARRRLWWWAHGLSASSFSNVVRPHSSLVVGGVRRLRGVVTIFNRVWWWWGRCLHSHMLVVVRGWLGCAPLVAGGLS